MAQQAQIPVIQKEGRRKEVQKEGMKEMKDNSDNLEDRKNDT